MGFTLNYINMRNFVLFIIVSSFSSFTLFSQSTVTLRGQIVDSKEGTGVPYAVVQINSKAGYTDAQGHFTLDLAKAGHYKIRIEHLGYQAWTQHLDTLPEGEFRVPLQPTPLILEEILVTDRNQRAVPQSEVLRDSGLVATQPRDLGDWLREVPGFGIIRRGGYALDPVFRSFKYEQLNLIYDGGVQLTHACPNRMDPATTHVTPEEIEKIELIKGPFSVRYGPAMGATVNVVTEAPQRNGRLLSGAFETGYEANGNGRLARLSMSGGNDRYDFYANGGWKDFDNYLAGDDTEVPSAFTSYDYALKTGFQPSDRQRLQLGWRQSFGRDILHAGLPMDTDTDNSSVLSLDYSARQLSPSLYGLTAKAYGTWIDHVMSNSRRPNFRMVEAVSTVEAATYGGKLELNWLPSRRMILYTGLDARYVGRSGNRDRLVKRNMMTGEELPLPMELQDIVWPDAGIFNGGLFAEGRFLLNDRFMLMTGLRGDFNTARADTPDADFEELYGGEVNPAPQWNLSANASLHYRLAENWSLQLALGRGVRSANMIERYINHFTVGQDPHEYVGNPHLRPEANHQAELSITRSGERLTLSANAFFSYFTDYITAAVDSSLRRKYMPMLQPRFAKRFQNIDAATQTGFELSASYRLLEHLRAYGSLAYTRAQNLDWDEPLPEIPPLEGIAGLKYQRPQWWLDARGRFVDQQEQTSASFAETMTPGFSVFDLRAGWKPTGGLTLGLAVLNVFDRHYYEHLNRSFVNMSESGVLFEPGRNVTLFGRLML